MAESEEELKSLFVRVKEEGENVGLQLKILKKTKIKTPTPITSCEIEGEKNGKSNKFYFLGPQITVAGDCSYKIKRCLLL